MRLRNKFRDYLSGQLTGHTDNFETSQNNIITSLRQGYSLSESVQQFGYDEEKIRRWYNEGSKGVSDYYNFYMICDSFVSSEIRNHDLKIVYEKLSDGKSFHSAVGDGDFTSDTYNSPEIIRQWIISGKNGDQEFKELYEVVRRYTFADLLDMDIDIIISSVHAGQTNLNFLDSNSLYCRREDFGKWYKSVNHSDERYLKLTNNCGDFFKRNSKDQFLYKLNKGFILGESFETDFHNFKDFINWYIAGSKGNSADMMFYKNVRSILVRNNNFNEYYTDISNRLKPDVPFDDVIDDELRIYVDEWIRLGKYGLEPFYSFYKDFLKHETQYKVIQYLKEGYEFSSNLPDLDFDFETVQAWFDEKGEFYDICLNIFISATEFRKVKKFLTDITPGVTLDNSIETADVSRKNIEKWMEYGKKGYGPFAKFYTGLLKTVILKGLSRKLSFEESFNLLGNYYSFDEFRDAYDSDLKFQKKFSGILIKNTNFAKAKSFLEDFNLEITLDENLSNSNVTESDLNQWLSLANNSFKPFDQFHETYNKYLTQNKVIMAIKQGSTFEQAINISSPVFNDQEIREWYDSKEGKFYEICYRLTEKESQALVISYLEQGLTFEQAINQENLLHNAEDIQSWFMLGKNGDDNFADFYNDVGKTLLISQLKRGLYLNNAIAASSGLIGMDYVKNQYRQDKAFYDEVNKLLVGNTFYYKYKEVLSYLDVPFPYFVVEWLNLAENGFDPFVVFYEEYKQLIKRIQNLVIDSLNNGMSIEEIIQLKEVNCSFNVLKSWYDEGSRNIADFVEFYKAIDGYKTKLVEMKEKRTSGSPDFKDKNKIVATQKFVIDSIVKGESFEDVINIDYLYYAPETIERWYFEGLVTKRFSNFANVIYKHIKSSNSSILIKSFVLLKMKNGVRFKELANLGGFNHQFDTINQWYEDGLNGNKEHEVFASIVKEYDGKLEEWRKAQEQRKLEAEKQRQEMLKKQKEAEERRKIEEKRKLEEAKKKQAEEEMKKLEEKRKEKERLRMQVKLEEEKMEREKRLAEEKEKARIDEEKRLAEEKQKAEEKREEEIAENKKKIEANQKKKADNKEKKKIKELKRKEKKNRMEREERLKRQREEINKDEILNKIKN